jgi:hypothetical protein
MHLKQIVVNTITKCVRIIGSLMCQVALFPFHRTLTGVLATGYIYHVQLTCRLTSQHAFNSKYLSLDDAKIGVVVVTVQRRDHVLGYGNIAFIDHGGIHAE